MPADGGEAVQVTPNQGRAALEAADGRSLLPCGLAHVAGVAPPRVGGEPKKVLDGVVWFNLCLVGNGAYYIDRLGAKRGFSIWTLPPPVHDRGPQPR